MARIVVTRQIPTLGLELLQQAGETEVFVWPEPLPPRPEVLRALVPDCVGLLALLTDQIDASLLAAAPCLKVVSNFAVGYNNIDVPACRERGVAVGNTPGAMVDATADIACGLMLMAGRRMLESALDARAGRWQTWEPLGWLGQEVRGKTLGIVGLGRIGYAVARRMHFGFEMNILYTARQPKPDADAMLSARKVSLEELLAQSDFVSIHADLNPTTLGLFNAARFAQMKRTAVLVNTGRGGHIVQEDLVEALRTGTIFAAGLDVTDPEPLPPTHPLYQLPNCVIVPHIASATVATRNTIARMAVENLLAGLHGRPLPHPVTGSTAAT